MQTENNSQCIEFYFDPVSPYAWLGSSRLSEISSRTGLVVVAKPVLFAGLLNAHGHVGPAEIPAKRNYIFRDALRRAQALGLAIECPPNHPFNPLLALRICTAIDNNTQCLEFAISIMNAAWGQGQDITERPALEIAATHSGVDIDWALAVAGEQHIKQSLMDNTEHAVKLGIFGVPTFRVGQEMFWGEDRVDQLLDYCRGDRIDEAKLSNILSREPAASRK